jgi:serine/threonine protein phosphatase PrpC
MFAATHIGRDHARVGRNNQDGVFVSERVAVVTDGCGSQPHSEVGARLGAQFLGRWLSAQRELDAALPERAIEALTAFLRQMVAPFEGAGDRVLEEAYLFTCLAAVLVEGRGLVFGVGDGALLVDDVLVRLDAGPENAPPYCAYRLGGRGPAPQLHFIGDAKRLVVMTDGFDRLETSRLLTLVSDGDALRRNPLTLQRRLNVLAEAERFSDDATLALVEG